MIDGWSARMAWRDSRGSRRQLLLFLSSMVLGVAALVAINSFGENLERAVDAQKKELLGADLSLESRSPFSRETEALIDSLGGRQSRRVSFASMAFFPESGSTRLVTVRAVQGAYPFYGELITRPASAARTYLQGRGALVDGALMEQYDVEVGDSVRIGANSYRVHGALDKTPRENEVMSVFSPRVFIPRERLDENLLTTGSRAEYEVYFQFEEGRDVEALVASIEPYLDEQRLGYDTVEEAEGNWREGLENLYRFLSLVGFMALLLGGIGVASAVHVYVKQRLETVAVLRCIGAKARRTFSVYLLQAAAMGVLGGIAGCALGVVIQWTLPYLLADFLPIEVAVFMSWRSIALGLFVGLAVTLLFALLPLLSVRDVSPLLALRSSVEPQRSGRDLMRWLVFALLAAGILVFAVIQAPMWQIGLGYAAGVAVVFGLLALVARGIILLTRRFFPSRWAYVWRQGIANLYRPNNQTTVLMLSLGLGTFLIMTLFVSERTLLSQVRIAGGEGRPNLVFFDVQPDQLEGVTEAVEAEGLPVSERVPIVTMRLQSVNGRTIESMRADSTFDVTWAHRREYRSTYRDYLTDSEEVVEGTFQSGPVSGEGLPPVSMEREVVEELGVGVGDTLVWDVQGVPLETVIGSLREVDWQRIATNFFAVFPPGLLEEAPQFFVILARAPDEATSGDVQSNVVQSYPNVSAIDLSLVMQTFDAIVGRISFVIRFMALFSILTGLVVLVGAVVVSRYQRVEESVLLKTLGASRRQVVQIMLVEYFFLGILATSTGLILSLGGGWALARFVFETRFVPAWDLVLLTAAAVTAITMLVGMINSRGFYDRPALEVLRSEV